MDHHAFDELLEQKFAQFFGQLTKHFDERDAARERRQDARIDQVHIGIDTILKRLETERLGRAALEHQADRHERWIGQLARTTGTKLVPEP